MANGVIAHYGINIFFKPVLNVENKELNTDGDESSISVQRNFYLWNSSEYVS